jgi:hypothetical protein
MAEVLLSSEELTVLGGPSQISVDVDFGPKGDRGSLIFYGLGKPDIVVLPETPQVFDSYVNLLTSDDEYLFMYQYIAGPSSGTPVWTKLFKLTPNIYSENLQRTFDNGSISINLPLEAIVPSGLIGNYTASSFNIQVNVLGVNPVSTAVSVSEILIDQATNTVSLPISINAVEYVDGEWGPLSGTKTVHLLITVV